jgi:ABC-type multidrug transport system fused ATPase/permease subunit
VTSNDKLEISVLFTSFQLVNSMTFPIMLIPTFFNQIFKNILSIQRLQNYLFTGEHQDKEKYKNLDEFNNDGILVKFEKINFGMPESGLGVEPKVEKVLKEIKSAKSFEHEM